MNIKERLELMKIYNEEDLDLDKEKAKLKSMKNDNNCKIIESLREFWQHKVFADPIDLIKGFEKDISVNIVVEDNGVRAEIYQEDCIAVSIDGTESIREFELEHGLVCTSIRAVSGSSCKNAMALVLMFRPDEKEDD